MLAMDAFFALSDPTRRAIVELLAQHGELPASEIAGHFPMSAPAISQHLKVLREANVVTMEKRAQQRIYRINPQAVQEVENWAGRMTRLWQRRFDALDDLLREELAKQASEARQVETEEKGLNHGDPSEQQANDHHPHI
jgi:DNA-binding transcriptional ArsR family regulator